MEIEKRYLMKLSAATDCRVVKKSVPQANEDTVDRHGLEQVLVCHLLLLFGVCVVWYYALVEQGVATLSPPSSPPVSLCEARLLVIFQPVGTHVVELEIGAVTTRFRVGAVGVGRDVFSFLGDVVGRAAVLVLVLVLVQVLDGREGGAGEGGGASSSSGMVIGHSRGRGMEKRRWVGLARRYRAAVRVYVGEGAVRGKRGQGAEGEFIARAQQRALLCSGVLELQPARYDTRTFGHVDASAHR